jgi:hypothetical protein
VSQISSYYYMLCTLIEFGLANTLTPIRTNTHPTLCLWAPPTKLAGMSNLETDEVTTDHRWYLIIILTKTSFLIERIYLFLWDMHVHMCQTWINLNSSVRYYHPPSHPTSLGYLCHLSRIVQGTVHIDRRYSTSTPIATSWVRLNRTTDD